MTGLSSRLLTVDWLGCFCLGNHGSKCLGVADGEISEHLAVEQDICLAQAKDQLAVGKTILAGTSINPGYPQTAQVALAIFPVSRGVPHALEARFVRAADQAMPAAKLTFCKLENSLVA